MKLLFDACVWGGARARVTDAGHEAEWVADWPTDPGDEEILAKALAAGQILITLDKDFGELAVLRRQRHCGILRLVGLGAREQVDICLHVLENFSEEIATGALVTATRNRIRVRPPDSHETP